MGVVVQKMLGVHTPILSRQLANGHRRDRVKPEENER
jgi:hypothetical protein